MCHHGFSQKKRRKIAKHKRRNSWNTSAIRRIIFLRGACERRRHEPLLGIIFPGVWPVLMLLWGGCLTASRTELKQGVVLDERRPVVLSAKEVLSQQELDEATAWAEYAKGSSLLIDEKPDFVQAAAHLTKALSLLPDSHSIATALIGPRLAGKEMEKAVAELKIVADANPTAPIPNLLYAECLAMLKRQDEAIEHLLKTIALTNWQEPQIVQTAALMLSRDKDPKRTEKFFRQAFARRHLRDNHVLQTIAASFWLDVADFRQALLDRDQNSEAEER